MRHAPAVLSLLTLAACDLGPPAVGELERPIIGGTYDTGDTSVVLIIAETPQGDSLCTGTVVSRHVVLTAAHCVSPAVIGSGVTFYVFLGDDVFDPAQQVQGNFLSVRETHYHSRFDVDNLDQGFDVGVVVTNNVIPRAALPMHRAPLNAGDINANTRLIGFGDTAGGANDSGKKRQTSTVIGDYDAMLIGFYDPTHMTCQGDSGGPALVRYGGVEEIVGICSFGGQNCTNYAVHVRVDVLASFADTYIQQFDGVSSPDLRMAPPDLTRPVDLAAPPEDLSAPAEPDLSAPAGGDMGIPAGAVGAPCAAHGDCDSRVCAFVGSAGYCTQPCDPMVASSCPSNMYCGVIDNERFCLKRAGGSSSGCDVAPGSPALPGAALVLLGLALLGLVARRRFS